MQHWPRRWSSRWGKDAAAAEADITGFEFGCQTPDGQLLKPVMGDVGGVYYIDLPYQQEQCHQAVKRKIAVCRMNTTFDSYEKDEKYAPCLPIFEEQAEACVAHFEFERGKCDAGSTDQDEPAPPGGIEEEWPQESYAIDPLDQVMEVVKRANVRAGPGTDYDTLGTVDAGVGVRVTGRVRGRDWLRVDLREDGGAAFIYAPLLKSIDDLRRNEPSDPAAIMLGSWSIDWQGANHHYTGTMTVDRQIGTDTYHGVVDLRWAEPGSVQQEATITVSGNTVTIECYNPSMDTWWPDNYYVTLSGQRMDGHSVDDKGQRGSSITFTKLY